MKHIAIIGTILILLILTAGCLNDLSSTLPPCCDGTCDGVKTSVITVDTTSGIPFVVDSDRIYYNLYGELRWSYDPYNNHNVTFSYEMVNGHRHITGIIEDHDAEPKCDCCGCEEYRG